MKIELINMFHEGDLKPELISYENIEYVKRWYRTYSYDVNFDINKALKLMSMFYYYEDLPIENEYANICNSISKEYSIEKESVLDMYFSFRKWLLE